MAGTDASLSVAEVDILGGLDQGLQPQAIRHRERVIAAGIPYTFISGRRSHENQARLYRRYLDRMETWHEDGQRGPRPRPAAKPGRSKHNLGFAWDFTGPRTDEEWNRAGVMAEGMGLESGHRYNDPGHIEQPDDLAVLRGVVNVRTAAVLAAMGLAWVIAKDS